MERRGGIDRESRRRHFWLVTTDPDSGKYFLIYGGPSEEEARQRGIEMLSGVDFEIRALRTRNLATASALVRGTRLESTHSLHRASERIGHDRSVRRYLQKRREPSWRSTTKL